MCENTDCALSSRVLLKSACVSSAPGPSQFSYYSDLEKIKY